MADRHSLYDLNFGPYAFFRRRVRGLQAGQPRRAVASIGSFGFNRFSSPLGMTLIRAGGQGLLGREGQHGLPSALLLHASASIFTGCITSKNQISTLYFRRASDFYSAFDLALYGYSLSSVGRRRGQRQSCQQ